MDVSQWVGLTKNEEHRQKWVMMHQSSLCEFQKEIKIWDQRQKLALEIQKSLYGDKKIENLINSTCFYPRVSWVHVFCSKFSRVHMFFHDTHSKLVPESMQPGVFWVEIFLITQQKTHELRFSIRTKGKYLL